MRRFCLGVLALAVLCGMAKPAEALVLCVPKKGVGPVKIRAVCKPKEVTIAPADIGAGLSGYEIVTSAQQQVFVENSGGMPGLSAVVTQACPAGKSALAGGSDLSATDKGVLRDVSVVLSQPTDDGSGWEEQLFNKGIQFDFNAELVIRVACATAAP